MEITKGKYTVTFSQEDKNAIARIHSITDQLYNDNICTDLKCEFCPLVGFCGAGSDLIANIKEKLEKFINEE